MRERRLYHFGPIRDGRAILKSLRAWVAAAVLAFSGFGCKFDSTRPFEDLADDDEDEEFEDDEEFEEEDFEDLDEDFEDEELEEEDLDEVEEADEEP